MRFSFKNVYIAAVEQKNELENDIRYFQRLSKRYVVHQCSCQGLKNEGFQKIVK